ncbi:Carbohydrate-binding WSC subgroup [Penicillium verhagenii]|nr:Carbohydrate-binding WSC subgroup [Penicillium verhagenii]
MHTQSFLASLALIPLVAASSSLGCFSAVPDLKDVKQYTFQSHGFCIDQCTEAGFHIAALKDGITCGCSNSTPLSSAKVDDDKCDQYCPGWPDNNCGGINVYTVLTTGDYHGSSNSVSNNAIPARTGRNIVAPTVNPSAIPTNILTAPSSMGTKAGITALPSAAKSNAAAAAITAATTSSTTPSATPNAADTLRSGSLFSAFFAGLSLLL